MKKITQFAQLLPMSEDTDMIITDETFPEPEVTETNIRIRLKNPDMFEQDSFRTITLTKGVKAVIGKLKGETTTEIQTILFDKDKFTVAEANAWVQRHKDSFSKATQFEQGKHDLFVYDGIEVSETNILELFEAHIKYHLPLLKPSGIEKILRVARINTDDLLETSQEEDMQEHLVEEEEEIIMSATKSIESYGGESEIFERILQIESLLQK